MKVLELLARLGLWLLSVLNERGAKARRAQEIGQHEANTYRETTQRMQDAGQSNPDLDAVRERLRKRDPSTR